MGSVLNAERGKRGGGLVTDVLSQLEQGTRIVLYLEGHLCMSSTSSIEEFFINFQKVSSLNDMSVFSCLCKSPNMLNKQTNKYPFDSLAAPSTTLPHAAGSFL